MFSTKSKETHCGVATRIHGQDKCKKRSTKVESWKGGSKIWALKEHVDDFEVQFVAL